MLQTDEMQQKLSRAFTREQSVLLSDLIHEKFEELVKTSDFRELKDIVAEVAKQQKETSAEVKSLSAEVKSLSVEMKALAKQQQETSAEVKSLSVEMKALAEQQKKTSAEVEILARGLNQVRKDVDQIRKELGGLATTVGYRLEDEAYKSLPALLFRDFNIQVSSRLKRGYLTDIEGNSIEVNIIGKAKQDDENILIIGEAKSQLSKKFVDEFLRKKLNRLPKTEKTFTILVTYMITAPDVEEYVKSKGIQLYYSYDF